MHAGLWTLARLSVLTNPTDESVVSDLPVTRELFGDLMPCTLSTQRRQQFNSSVCSGTCTQGVSSHAKTRKTGNDTLGGELQNTVLTSFFAPPNKTRYLPGNQSGPTRKQKLDSTPIDVRVRRQRLGSNAPIESAPASMLRPLLLRLPGHFRLSHSVYRYLSEGTSYKRISGPLWATVVMYRTNAPTGRTTSGYVVMLNVIRCPAPQYLQNASSAASVLK